jgi:hypothetical protein
VNIAKANVTKRPRGKGLSAVLETTTAVPKSIPIWVTSMQHEVSHHPPALYLDESVILKELTWTGVQIGDLESYSAMNLSMQTYSIKPISETLRSFARYWAIRQRKMPKPAF